MHRYEQIIAFLATLFVLLSVYIATLLVAASSPGVLDKAEIFGLGTITGGLIGILRIPTQRGVHIDNTPSDPVPTDEVAK